MTDQITTLRKFSSLLFAAATLGNLPVAAAERPSYGKLPVIKNVGLLPLAWEGDHQGTFAGRPGLVQQAYLAAFRDAKRFHVINDEITTELWHNPEGRKELKDQYELQALASLSVHPDHDALTFVVRLMSLEMENFIVETDRVPRSWFESCLEEELKDRIESLVFRLLNRFPVDVSVTSVQGRYITLSGGAGQNVRQGDRLTFFRSTITDVHPANGSWLAFQNRKLGTATVIDAKANSAVAELTALSYEEAIEVGDGARVDGIESRAKFKRLAELPTFHDAQDGSPVIGLPGTGPQGPKRGGKLLPGGKAPKTAQAIVPVPAPSSDVLPEQPATPQTPPEVEAPPAAAAPEGDTQPPAIESEGEVEPTPVKTPASSGSEPVGTPPALLAALGEQAQLIHFGAGIRSWSVAGSVTANSVMPAWLFNHFEAGAAKAIGPVVVDGTFDLEYGPTGKGTYTGFGFEALGKYPIKLTGGGVLDQINVGGAFRYHSFGVEGEKFGGGNIMKAGAMGGLQGTFPLTELKKLVDFSAELTYYLYGSGSFGVKGKDRVINSLSGFRLRAEVVPRVGKKSLEMGGFLLYDAEDYLLSKGSLNLSGYGIGFLGRYRF